MQKLITVIGIALIIMAIFLVISVLMQSSKNHRVSGTVAGGAETFFGKTKGKTMDAIFNKLTTVVTIIFVILVVVLYVIQPDTTTPEDYIIPDGQISDVVEDNEGDVADNQGDVVDDAQQTENVDGDTSSNDAQQDQITEPETDSNVAE